MKYIITILFSLVCYCSFGQYVNTTQQGSATTLINSKGGSSADSSVSVLSKHSFTDTATANFSVVSKYKGTIIYTTGDAQYWIRRLLPYPIWDKFNTSAASLVSISQGVGIILTPNPITTVGTAQADTVALSTRAWRQKGIDSVVGLIPTQYWQRNTTTLSPINSGDNITTTVTGLTNAIQGVAASGIGIKGQSTDNGYGVTGEATGSGIGVQGTSVDGSGVVGISTTSTGVFATNNSNFAPAALSRNYGTFHLHDFYSADTLISYVAKNGLFQYSFNLNGRMGDLSVPNKKYVDSSSIHNQNGVNMSSQTAKFWVSDTIKTSNTVVTPTINLFSSGGNLISNTSTGTNAATIFLQNDAGMVYYGVNNNAGNFISGAAANATVLWNVANVPVQIGVNGALVESHTSTQTDFSNVTKFANQVWLTNNSSNISSLVAGRYTNPNSSLTYMQMNAENATGYFKFYTSDALRFTIDGSGNLIAASLAGTGSRAVLAASDGTMSAPVSDSSVKEDFLEIDSALYNVMKLHPLTFKYKDDYKKYGEGRLYGHLAQQVENIFPSLIFTTPSSGKKGIDYGTGQFQSILVKAIQDLKNEKDTEILELKNKLAYLEQKVNQLLNK